MTHSAEPELEITVSDHHWSAGHWGPMLIFVWRGVTSVERVTTVGRLTSEVAARCPNGVGVLVVLEPEASTPNEEARKLLASVMRDRSAVVKGLAYAVVGAGFGAAAVRAVIAGLSLLAREGYPTRVFSTTADAAAWLVTRVSPALAPASFVSVIERARARR
jgi:hypothetical protein